jgi:predicted hotdog family 3-hydroxylacyl-ACP dehydratase
MCLLDSVEHWGDGHIVCRATSHHRLDNPLRDDSGLRALCGIEYGAQAIAAHGALVQGVRDPNLWSGVLVSARHVMTTRSHLNDLAGALTIRATLLVAPDHGSVYNVEITSDGRTLLTGRLSVMLSVGYPPRASSASTEGNA